MDDVAGFKLGIAEHLGVALADQQACQGEDVAVGTSADARREFLGLGFQFRIQGLVERHGVLLREGEFAVEIRFSHVMDKSSTNFAAAHTAIPVERK